MKCRFTKSTETVGLPQDTLVRPVHVRPCGTTERVHKVRRVGERAPHAELPGRVRIGEDLVQQSRLSRLLAPNLRWKVMINFVQKVSRFVFQMDHANASDIDLADTVLMHFTITRRNLSVKSYPLPFHSKTAENQ